NHPLANQAETELIAGQAADLLLPATRNRRTLFQLRAAIRPRVLLNLIFLNVQTILSTLADNIYSNWIPLFLWEVHHLKFEAMGIYSSLPLLGGAAAGMIGGVLNDACIARSGNRRWSRTAIAAAGKGM